MFTKPFSPTLANCLTGVLFAATVNTVIITQVLRSGAFSHCKPLIDDKFFPYIYINKKESYGFKYANFLTGLDKNQNEKWWNKRYLIYKQDLKEKPDSLSTEFKNPEITNGYSIHLETSLSKVCENIFFKNTSEIEQDQNTNLINNIWKYCSPFNNIFKTIEQGKDLKNYEQETIGYKFRSYLLDYNSPDNYYFWSVMENKFSASVSKSEFFQQVYANKRSSRWKPYLGIPSTLSKACDYSYKMIFFKVHQNKISDLLLDVLKLCSPANYTELENEFVFPFKDQKLTSIIN